MKTDNFEFLNRIEHHRYDENYKETKDRIIKRDACIKQCENYYRWKKIFIHFMLKLILKHQKFIHLINFTETIHKKKQK